MYSDDEDDPRDRGAAGTYGVTVTTVDGAGSPRTDALPLNVLEVYGEPCGTSAAKSADRRRPTVLSTIVDHTGALVPL